MADSHKIPQGAPVLVTGATGFAGSVLTTKLVQAGLQVRAIARPSSKLRQLADLPISWFRGDVFDRATVEAATKDVSYIFHVAAAYREAKISDDIYRKVHVESTKLLADAARRNANFRRFVHVSTVGVHGHIANPPADENYPFNPDDIYQVTKAEAELWLRDYATKNELPYTVIRPCAIYGPGDMRLLKVFRMAAKRHFPILGWGRNLYHLVHVEDLTDIMMLAAVHPNAQGEVFIAGTPEAMTLEGIARTIAASLNHSIRIIRLPAWPFFIAGDLCELICRPLGIEPPIYRRRVAFFTKDRSFNTAKLRERLGYQTRISNEEGLAQTAKWYIEHGYLKAPAS